MYPLSNDYDHNSNPISLSGQLISHRPLFNSDIDPNSIFEDLQSTSLTHFPSPLIQYDDAVSELTWQQLHDLFIQQQPFTVENGSADQINNMENIPKEDAAYALKQGWPERCARMPEHILRKRTSKKDRHSKITTAQGPRDRRMRLSLDVARKFFDLQDILGFDKASKTVEWLLIQSSSAIKEIMRGLPRMLIGRGSVGANTSTSSTSECEVVSGIDDSTTNENEKACNSLKVKLKPSCCKKEKVAKLARRTALHKLARESRKVARERARKRTIEKQKLGETKSFLEARNGDLRQLGSWGQPEAVEESSTRVGKMHPSTHDEGLKEVEELNSQEQRILETRDLSAGDIFVITGNWNPSSIFSYQQNGETSHWHQFSDFQFGGKTWEVYSNI